MRDRGSATAVEMLAVVMFGLVGLLFLGYVGRLHAAGIQVQNTSQAAARAASQAPDPDAARVAMGSALATSSLTTRCDGALSSALSWAPSPTGTWQGGSVTVVVSCTLGNESLAGVWAPGDRTISSTDTQPVDRYQR